MSFYCLLVPAAVRNACECSWGPAVPINPRFDPIPMRVHVKDCPRYRVPRCMHRGCDPDFVPDVPEWPAPFCAICNGHVDNPGSTPRWCRKCWSVYQSERRALQRRNLKMDRGFAARRRNHLAHGPKSTLPPTDDLRVYLAARCGLCGTLYPPRKETKSRANPIPSRVESSAGQLAALSPRECATCSYAIRVALTKVPRHIIVLRREAITTYQDTVAEIRAALVNPERSPLAMFQSVPKVNP